MNTRGGGLCSAGEGIHMVEAGGWINEGWFLSAEGLKLKF